MTAILAFLVGVFLGIVLVCATQDDCFVIRFGGDCSEDEE